MGKTIRSLTLILVMACFVSSQAMASGSGAYRLEVADTAAAGMGSAFVGEADTAAAVYYNPAGTTQVMGSKLAIGGSLILPGANYTSNTGEESQMQRHSFLIPSTFFVSDLGTEKFALGLGATSSWGLGTEWHADSFAKYSATKSLVENKDYLMTVGYQVDEKLSVGVGLDIADSTVDKRKKLEQVGQNDGNFRLRGEDKGVGYKLATHYRLNERHSFGFIYRSAMELKYKGKVTLSGLALGTGTNYSVVFGGSDFETDVIAKTTLPQGVVLGYSYKPNDKWTWNFDVEWMDWSSTKKEELAFPGLNDTNDTTGKRIVLNKGNPASRDWASAISASFGTEYKMKENFRLRGGFYYRPTPIPDDTWEPNLPDSDSYAVTLGTGYDLRKDLTLDLAWSGIYYKDRVIDNTVASGTINGEYSQFTNLLYATLTYSF